jgi:sortase A
VQPQRASAARVPIAGRIIVPRLGLDTTMYEGGELAQIDHGPSHLPYTVMPGRQGNTVIAGHRTTETRPFHDLDRLQVGDTVTFVIPSGTYTYVFSHHSVVTEDGVHILHQGTGYEATLFACHPKGSSSHRLVAHFTLQSAPDPATTTTTRGPTTPPNVRLPGR